MLKAKAATVKLSPPRQSRKWPRCADLKPWLECALNLCEQHPKVEQAGVKACVPLKQLAECGHASAALTRLRRLLGKLSSEECQATGFLAITGAEICLDLPDFRRAEKYLRLAEARQSMASPKVQKAIQIQLKQLRLMNGLTESSDADSPNANSIDADSPLFQLGKCRAACRQALLAGDKKAAAKALRKAGTLIPEIDEFWLAPGLTLSLIAMFRRLEDEAALKRYLAWLDREGDSRNLATGSLRAMGLAEIANQRAQNLVVSHLKRLKHNPDSNIHFPVNEICNELWFFLQTGQRETAAKLLQRVLRELPQWPGLCGGFATSGVLTELAELLAEIDSPEAARKLLGLAVQAGQAESQPEFRKSALEAANQQIETPGLAAKVARARSLRNAKQRRETLLPLLTRQTAWSELATLLDEITNADDLLNSLHTVLFNLPGGNRLA